MNDLRTAAQQALDWLYDNDILHPTKVSEDLRAALAQQAEPASVAAAMRDARLNAGWSQQAEPLNLADPAVRKRLAAQWGYVPAAQAEPVEPLAWLAPDGSVRETPAAKSFGEWVWGPDDFRPLYIAPPQRKPLTEEEIDGLVIQHAGYGRDNFYAVVRAVERAHGIKE